MGMNLMWYRNDLRVADNPALWHAAEEGRPVIALFIITPDQWASHDMAACRARFVLASLETLREDLAALGIPLQVLRGSGFDRVPRQLADFCRKHGVDGVFWNNEYPFDEVERDRAVEQALANDGVKVRRFHDRVLVPPDKILTQQGEPYKVFTPFKRNLLARLEEGLPDLLPPPKKQRRPGLDLNDIPARLAGFRSHIALDLWPAGENEAHKRLERFVDDALDRYGEQRDFPAVEGTSLLSPYLAVGNLSPQQCLLAALPVRRRKGADTWIGEIVWRDFYQYIAWHFPRVCKCRPFDPATEAVPWRNSDGDFHAWKTGATGVPLVDAGMRQLRHTGWMHNRVRMVTAMFLSKNLLLDWRLGERFFMNHLIDGDVCSNNGGWQWSASTGTDAAPYFRVFNPFTQGERFDPEAAYIKRWVPELETLDAVDIHKPARLRQAKPEGYPDVIVDLKGSRERAINAFKAGRRD